MHTITSNIVSVTKKNLPMGRATGPDDGSLQSYARSFSGCNFTCQIQNYRSGELLNLTKEGKKKNILKYTKRRANQAHHESYI